MINATQLKEVFVRAQRHAPQPADSGSLSLHNKSMRMVESWADTMSGKHKARLAAKQRRDDEAEVLYS